MWVAALVGLPVVLLSDVFVRVVIVAIPPGSCPQPRVRWCLGRCLGKPERMELMVRPLTFTGSSWLIHGGVHSGGYSYSVASST